MEDVSDPPFRSGLRKNAWRWDMMHSQLISSGVDWDAIAVGMN
jgi:hypothetical protein